MAFLFRNLFLLILIAINLPALAQIDSIPLKVLELREYDIIKKSNSSEGQKVVSGTRTLQDIDEVPLTIHVITKEEIQKYGYVTLVDALKHLPGIRVSQPGSALDGETFLMRGLRGNNYCKILINNTPIKPSVAAGMPLGAQLPIQQAERIEVIYGPAAAVYGADASAGVINIILEKTERPTFVQAHLNSGSANGYSDLNLLFGGQLGRNKKVLNFSVYGSSTQRNNTAVVSNYLGVLYSPIFYAQNNFTQNIDTSYVKLNNYSGTVDNPNFSALPHLSRMFGMDLSLKSWSMSIQNMYRRDHAAIGLNPVAISYDNPQTYFGENISSVNTRFAKSNEKYGVELNIRSVFYSVDNRSSSQYVQPSLSRGLDLIAAAKTLESSPPGNFNEVVYDSLRSLINERYFSGNRFSYASTIDFGMEQIHNYNANRWLDLSFGTSFDFGTGSPLVTLARRPIKQVVFKSNPDQPIPIREYLGGNFNAFLQAYIKQEKWNVTLGLQYYAFGSRIGSYRPPFQTGFNPRIAALYKVNQKFSFRALYCTAFRRTSPYYYSNTFVLDPDINDALDIAELPIDSELTTSHEIGARWNPDSNIRMDFVGFYTFTDNIITYNFTTNTQSLAAINSVVGYFNNQDDRISVLGVQGSINYRNIIPSINLDAKLNFQYANSTRNFRMNDNAALEVPNWSFSGIISFKPLRKLSVSFLNVFQGDSLVNFRGDSSDKYYLLDTVFRLDISDKFQAMLKVNNFLNARYAGLSASNSPDDLFFNPQPSRTIQLGLTYRTN